MFESLDTSHKSYNFKAYVNMQKCSVSTVNPEMPMTRGEQPEGIQG